MIRIDLAFLILSSACLVAGVSMGIYMGMSHDFGLTPVHVHMNLLGWASCALFGLVYRAYPEMARRKSALAHLLLSGSSGVLFPIGIYFAIFHEQHALVAVAAPLWWLGAVLFLVNLVRALFARERMSAPRFAD